MMVEHNCISQQELNLLIRKKHHLYNAMVAHGYYMPDEHSPFCTKAWMQEVR